MSHAQTTIYLPRTDADRLFDDIEMAERMGFDTEASVEIYDRMLEQQVREMFPAAAVVTGSDRWTVDADTPEAEAIFDAIVKMADDLFISGAYLVERAV